jgi:hypothetical protein
MPPFKSREMLVRTLYVIVVAAAAVAGFAGLTQGIVIGGLLVACAMIEAWRWWRDKSAPETPPTEEEVYREAIRWPWQRAWPYLAGLGLMGLGVGLRVLGAPWALLGIACGFGLVGAVYVFLSQMESARAWRSGRRKLGPTVSDWTALGVCGLFSLVGLGAVWHAPGDRAMWAALAFFALCSLVGAQRVRSKVRRARFAATSVEVVGGVPIRASVGFFLVLGTGLTVVAALFLIAPLPLLLQACGAVMGVAGIVLLGAVLTGQVGRRFIRFDPDGLTMNQGNVQYQVAWNSIVDLAEYQVADLPFVGFNIAGLEESVGMWAGGASAPMTPTGHRAASPGLRVTPPDQEQRVLKRLRTSLRRESRHVVICPLHFGLDSGVLAAAIATYLADPSARAALAARPALPPGA